MKVIVFCAYLLESFHLLFTEIHRHSEDSLKSSEYKNQVKYKNQHLFGLYLVWGSQFFLFIAIPKTHLAAPSLVLL